MDSIAFIPVRKGSKGIENKNMIDLAGKPLLHWTLKACEESKVNKVFVYGDDNAFETAMIPFKKCKFIRRPDFTATDTALCTHMPRNYWSKKAKG